MRSFTNILRRPGTRADDSTRGKRDRAILSTLLFHALRRDELCKLKVRDCSGTIAQSAAFAAYLEFECLCGQKAVTHNPVKGSICRWRIPRTQDAGAQR